MDKLVKGEDIDKSLDDLITKKDHKNIVEAVGQGITLITGYRDKSISKNCFRDLHVKYF